MEKNYENDTKKIRLKKKKDVHTFTRKHTSSTHTSINKGSDVNTHTHTYTPKMHILNGNNTHTHTVACNKHTSLTHL